MVVPFVMAGVIVTAVGVVGYRRYLQHVPESAWSSSPSTPPSSSSRPSPPDVEMGRVRPVEHAWSGEVQAIVASIQAGEEAYRAEHATYLGCSGCSGPHCAESATLLYLYPHAVPDPATCGWENPEHPDYACWKALGVHPGVQVRHVYAVFAGAAGSVPPTIPGLAAQPAWPSPTREPWYVIEAFGDVDGDGDREIAASSSFSPELLVENEGE